MVWGLFVLTSTETFGVTVGFLLGVGLATFVLSFVSFRLAKRGRPFLAALCFAAALSAEVFEVLAMAVGGLLLGPTTVYVLLIAHGVPTLLCIVLYGLVSRVQRKLVAKLNARMATEAVPPELTTDELKVAATRTQAWARGHRGRKMAVRLRELRAWTALATERRVLVALVYGIVFVLILFCTYINMLYGVLFSPAQSRAWVLSSVTAFLTDALFNTPVVMLAKTAFAFGRRVLATSLNATLMSKLTYDAARKHNLVVDRSAVLESVLHSANDEE